jgi:hypothetical protein
MMRTILLVVLASGLWAQSPAGAMRLRYGNASSQHLNRTGLDDGAAWDFGAVSGNVAPAFGNACTMTANGSPAAGTGYITLDGTGSQYYACADSPALSPTSTFTISAVARASAQADITMVAKWATSPESFAMWCGGGAASDKCQCNIKQSDNTDVATTAAADAAQVVNTWAVWTCVADGARVTLYKNGLATSGSQPYNGTLGDNTGALHIGTFLGFAPWSGRIAMAAYRKYPLTAPEVRQSYKAVRNQLCNTYPATGAGTFCTDLPQ